MTESEAFRHRIVPSDAFAADAVEQRVCGAHRES